MLPELPTLSYWRVLPGTAKRMRGALTASPVPQLPENSPGTMDVSTEDQTWLKTQLFAGKPIVHLEPLSGVITTWIHGYSRQLFERPWTGSEGQRYRGLQSKLWACWRYHWMAEAVNATSNVADGYQVMRRIEAGQGLKGRSLDGNVIHDLILSWGAICDDKKSYRTFMDTYEAYAKSKIETNCDYHVRNADWWADLGTDLFITVRGTPKPHSVSETPPMSKPSEASPTDYSIRPCLLDKYKGEQGLKPWMCLVILRVIRGVVRGTKKSKVINTAADAFDSSAEATDSTPLVEKFECHDRVKRLLNDARSTLDDKQRRCLEGRLMDMKFNELAPILGCSVGNAHKVFERTIHEMRKAISVLLCDRHAATRDCVYSLLGMPDDIPLEEVLDKMMFEFTNRRRQKRGMP